MAIEQRRLRQVDFLAQGWTAPSVIGMQPAEAVMTIMKAFEDHVASSPQVLEYLRQMPNGPGTSCPDSKPEELAKFLAYRRGDINQSDPVIMAAFAADVMAPMLEFRRKMVGTILVYLGLRGATEDQMACEAGNLAASTDELYLAWFRKMSVPYQRLSLAERERIAREWRGQLGEYDYSVFDIGPTGEIQNRQTWAMAFPDEVQCVVNDLDILRETLGGESIMSSTSTPL